MRIIPPSLIGLSVEGDDLYKEKKRVPLRRPGKKSRLSIGEMVTIYVWFLRSKGKDFKTFYEGCQGQFLREYFPAMPDYSNFLKPKKRQAEVFFQWHNGRKNRGSC
jgi:hypothetical protein